MKKHFNIILHDGSFIKSYRTSKAVYQFIVHDPRAKDGGCVERINQFGDSLKMSFLQFLILYLRENATSALSQGKDSPLW